MENDYDIVIVGGGGAGLAAAITAHDLGARVIVAESQDDVGGSTRLSGGVFYAAGTSVQHARGIDDIPEAMFRYYMTLNQWRVEPDLAWTLCVESAPALEWLIEQGVMFPPDALYASGVEEVPRGHAPLAFGAAIIAALEQGVIDRGIDIALHTRVQRLLTEEGSVVGVEATNGESVRTAATIITTGGFGQNPNLLSRHYPEATSAGDWMWSVSAAGCVGDALGFADQVAAATTGHDRGLLLITPGFNRDLEVDPPGWLVFVNAEGRRFGSEDAPYAVMSGLFKEQGGSAWAVFDERSRRTAAPDSQYADAFAAGIVAVNFLPDVITEQVENGRVLTAPTLEELAAAAGLPGPTLTHTISRYNDDCAAGFDSQFRKDSHWLQPVSEPPYYAVEMRPAIVCLTSYGLRIDPRARVQSARGGPIEGLYAAGEATGGVMGERYVGGGNSITNAIVFGRIAGREAASAALSTTR